MNEQRASEAEENATDYTALLPVGARVGVEGPRLWPAGWEGRGERASGRECYHRRVLPLIRQTLADDKLWCGNWQENGSSQHGV